MDAATQSTTITALNDFTDTSACSSRNGTLLRRMDCGCIVFSEPVNDNKEYLVIRCCDDDGEYEPDKDLRFFIRPFPDHNIKDSKIIPAAETWKAINNLMFDGITARRLKRTLSSLLDK